MSGLLQQTTVLTKSQKHWRAWVSALQTHDATLRAAALQQLGKFLDYWTAELYAPLSMRGMVANGHDTPQESWDEVFNVDTDLLIRSRRPLVRFDSEEAWVGPYGLDENNFESHHIERPPTMNPWDDDDGSKETRETLSRYFCGIQRLVIDCPFADVRRSCRKLLDKARRKHVEIPSLVNESPSWLIPLSEIIGFKTDNHTEIVTVQFPEKYISDESSSSSDSDVVFRSRTPEPDDTAGYSYYTSPEATPRPTFTTPAIPINAPPRTRSRSHHISRNTSQESIVHSTSNRRNERKFTRQPHATHDIRDFQVASFIAHGRVTNYAKVLCFMPRYVRCTSRCYEKLISSTRGLSRPIKTFIAILAAAESGCQYFVSYFTAKFLEVAGDSTWLKGMVDMPGRIQRISEMNRRLFVEPWKVTGRDVAALTEIKDVDEDIEEMWSVGDVVQIMTILAMFHAQSAIALATGVVCEADVFGGTIWRKISPSAQEAESSVEENSNNKQTLVSRRNGRGEIMDKLRMRMLGSGHMSPDMSFDNLQALRIESSRQDSILGRAAKKTFLECIEYIPATPGIPKDLSSEGSIAPTPATDDTPINPIIEDISRFTIHQDTLPDRMFPTTHPIMQINDHTWDSVLQTLQIHLPDLATNLDRRFHLPPTPTFLQLEKSEPIDVTPFRDALHYYSLALVGIMRDTYDYKLVGEFLDDKIRRFVRLIALEPRRMVKADWEIIKEMGFTNAEMVEIVVITCEARFMGVMIYAFKALGVI